MASTGRLSLRPPTARTVTPADNALVDVLRTRANWIWIEEPGRGGASAPDLEQRAFRKVFTFPTSKGKPTSTKFVIGADDYFALYVNGVLVQPADGTHDWTTLVGLQVPLPVIQNTTTDTMTLAFRVVNELGDAGLLVGVQVTYESGEPDTFFTGLDESWITERSFDEGWEQPWYAPSSWARAKIFPQNVRLPSESKDMQNVGVFEQLPVSATPTATGGCAVAGTPSPSINISVGGFAGALVGSVAAALIIGAMGSFFVLRKQVKKARNGGYNEGVSTPFMSEPTTLPGRQLHNLSTPSTHQFGGVASPPPIRYDSPSPPNNQYRDDASSSAPLASTHYRTGSAPSSAPQGMSGSAYVESGCPNLDESEPPTYTDGGPAAPRPVRTGKRQLS